MAAAISNEHVATSEEGTEVNDHDGAREMVNDPDHFHGGRAEGGIDVLNPCTSAMEEGSETRA